MARFNLICHGMMLFAERGYGIRIVIPNIKEHSYYYGSPFSKAGVCEADLKVLPTKTFTMTGIRARDHRLIDLISPVQHVVLKHSLIDVIEDPARTVIEIPKPDLIRCFRAVELGSYDICGETPKDAMLDSPSVLHDVLCFSYTNLDSGMTIRIGDWFQVVPPDQPGQKTSLCIYSQTEKAYAGPHTTGINDLLKCKDGRSKMDLRLSGVGTTDKGMSPAPFTGIDRCQLHNLVELTQHFETDPTGCTGASHCEGC